MNTGFARSPCFFVGQAFGGDFYSVFSKLNGALWSVVNYAIGEGFMNRASMAAGLLLGASYVAAEDGDIEDPILIHQKRTPLEKAVRKDVPDAILLEKPVPLQ